MAVVFDAKSTLSDSASPASWSHTCTGSNLLLVVVGIVRGAEDITNVTYNGVALTLAVQVNGPTNERTEIWYLVNPATGPNTIEVTKDSGFEASRYYAASFTGVLQTSPLDTTNSSSGTTQNPSTSVTTTAAGVVIDGMIHEDPSASTQGADQTLLYATDEGTWNTGASYEIESAATTESMDWTAGSSDTYSHAVAAFKDTTAGTTTSTTTSSSTSTTSTSSSTSTTTTTSSSTSSSSSTSTSSTSSSTSTSTSTSSTTSTTVSTSTSTSTTVTTTTTTISTSTTTSSSTSTTVTTTSSTSSSTSSTSTSTSSSTTVSTSTTTTISYQIDDLILEWTAYNVFPWEITVDPLVEITPQLVIPRRPELIGAEAETVLKIFGRRQEFILNEPKEFEAVKAPADDTPGIIRAEPEFDDQKTAYFEDNKMDANIELEEQRGQETEPADLHIEAEREEVNTPVEQEKQEPFNR